LNWAELLLLSPVLASLLDYDPHAATPYRMNLQNVPKIASIFNEHVTRAEVRAALETAA
jgi:hypothetical protein